ARLRRLYQHANHDELTSLLNRRGAKDAVNAALSRTGTNCMMLLVGIDQLKLIVAAHGHSAGEAVVATTAQAISKCASEGDITARIGEGEFMIFAADRDAARARDLAD